MDIIIIAAMAANRVIGRDNTIPWSLPEDLRQFKTKTLGHALIMGRKTYESLGRPLPGRTNIVISRNRDLRLAGCEVVADMQQALALCRGRDKVFIIGGGQIFELGISLADTIILTVLEEEVAGDTTFPDFTGQGFSEIGREQFSAGRPFSVVTYRRPRPFVAGPAAADDGLG